MNQNLPQTVLSQEITVRLPLSALINLGDSYKPGEDLPKIGSNGRVGIYAGVARADDQGPDHILEVLEAQQENLTWQQAMAWAASIGGTLPTRKQQALLFANVPELFEKEVYWSCEQYAGLEGYAWSQGFTIGYQYGNHKSYQLRARAVRRFNIE
jgi:hypothetical protein